MATVTITLSHLSVAARAVLFGPRNTRIDVLNAIRDAHGVADVEYGVNLTTYTQGEVDTAMTGFDGDIDNAAAGSVTADTGELVVLFTHAVMSHRGFRLDLINKIREGQDLDAVLYYVNTEQPTQAQLDAAIAHLEGL